MFVMVGDRYGRLVVDGPAPEDSQGKRQYFCSCDCGLKVTARAANLIQGLTSSCGCYRRETATKHGLSRSPEYTVWLMMIQRCSNPNGGSFDYYGGRGIRVCQSWSQSFETFYSDMGPRPSSEYTLERRDVNGHYEPGNCYWATPEVQANNRTNSVYCVIDDDKMTVAQAARKYGLNADLIYSRLRAGWSDAEAVFGKGKS